MRILQIAPLWESVPPAAYGGTEAVVHALTEELVRQGHDVTLRASGDSVTSARLQSIFPQSLRTADLKDKTPYSWQHSAMALRDAETYDIVHNHGGEEVMALSHLVPNVPMLTTTHCLMTEDTQFIWEQYEGFYNTVSLAQRRTFPDLPSANYVGVSYNSIDVASFPFQREKEDHLLHLSRISYQKGTHVAIEVARRAGRKLIIAGKVDPADRDYYETSVRPLIDDDQIVYVGEADGPMKRDLYKKASCLVLPILWEEPFGLVMAEAQACGTPVIVLNRGAAPEVVCDGLTGFVVDTVDEMVESVGRLSEIDPLRCRTWVTDRFDVPHMAERYLSLYEGILLKRDLRAAVLSANLVA